MRRLTLVLLILLIGGLRLTAQGSCRISNTQAIFFQNYSSATIQATGQVQFKCTSGTAYAIGLSAGTTAGLSAIQQRVLHNKLGKLRSDQLGNRDRHRQ